MTNKSASPDYVRQLIERWLDDATRLAAYGAVEHATVLRRCIVDLEAAEREYSLEALSLEDAVDESGFSYSSLQKKLAKGELENVGEKGKPRVRRCDIPKKGTPGYKPERSIAEMALRARP